MAVSLVGCGVVDGIGGSETKASPTKGDDLTVGLLLPETENTRYEKFDYPIIRDEVKKLTNNKGTVVYANAAASAAKQATQLQKMVDDKVDVLLVDAVDSKAIAPGVQKAKDAGIPVIAYDRLAEGPIDAYVSFDNELVGEVQGKALISELGSNSASKKIIMMNGSVTDPNAGWFKRGALSVLDGKVKIGRSYDTVDWQQSNAYANMASAIAGLGANGVDGVLAANDNLATGVISALRAAGVSPLPPVVGQDADLAAVRRIVGGEQYLTVYKPFKSEARAAADMAVALARGQSIAGIADTTVDSPTEKDIPAVLLTPLSVTAGNIKDTLVKDGLYTVGQICTPNLRAACAKVGLSP